MSKIKKLFKALKTHGLGYVFSFAWSKFVSAVKFVFLYPILKQKYRAMLSKLPLGERVFLWTVKFGWNMPLFQRPQHIARYLAEKGNTVFYFNDPDYDKDIDTVKQIMPNLYLVNRENFIFVKVLKDYLADLDKTKYFHLYSTNWETSLQELKAYEEKGFHVLYEYIDDLAPEIAGTSELPVSVVQKFDYATADDHIPMTVTADLLREQIISLRGEKNLAFSTNGVDVEHFRKTVPNFPFNEKFSNVLAKGNKIVGYYGAMAKWMDYDLLKFAAAKLPDVEFVLIGKKYDNSFDAAGVDSVPNINFIGPVPYQDLPQYANKFDLYTIPFLVNSITNATSPLKLFEYMAMGKPILTTAMKESSKYASVNVSHDHEEYVRMVQQLLTYTPETQPDYYALLARDAEENLWSRKAELIIEMLETYEANR